MTQLRDRHEDIASASAEPTKARPVVLATLSVRVDPTAERMAIDSAVEAGVPLVLVNLIPLPFYVTTLVLLGPEGTTLPHEEDLDEVRATAARAAELGVKTELLRVRHPACRVRAPRGREGARCRVARVRSRPATDQPAPFRSAARRVRREADCLVWIAPDG